MVKLGKEFREVGCSALVLVAIVLLGVNSLGQQDPAPAAAPGIQDNSFLVEEAYNQNFGVVQHISSFTRSFESKDWNYTFTQEWPVPGERHQLSYTLVALHAGAFPGLRRWHRRHFPELPLPVGWKWRHPGSLLASSQR